MENPATATVAAAKSAFTLRNIVLFIVSFILVNALMDLLSNLYPPIPAFVMRPVSTVKALVASKTAPKTS